MKDGENCYIVNFDCSNIDDVAKKITKKPKFKFEKLKDSYDTILAKGKSQYQEDIKTMVQVKCIVPDFKDIRATEEQGQDVIRTENEVWLTDKLRAEFLEDLRLVDII